MTGNILHEGQRTTRHRRGGRTAALLSTAAALLAALVAVGVPSAPASASPKPAVGTVGAYVMTDLGTLGGASSAATALNDAGQVVGGSNTDGTADHAFLWSEGVMTDLGGRGNSSAKDVNEVGQVVGYTGGRFDTHAAVWSGGLMTDLGTLGGAYSMAVDINEGGQIAGYAYTTPGDNYSHRPTTWTNGVLTDLGTLGGPEGEANAINDAGQIAGFSLLTGYSGSAHPVVWSNGVMTDLGIGGTAVAINEAGQVAITSSHALLWSDGVLTDLGFLPGGVWSGAVAINESGQVAGWSSTVYDQQNHAFLWSNGVMTDLGTLGGTVSAAVAINDVGQVTGWSYTAGDAETHAFVWADGVMTDLGTLGGTLSKPADINNAGHIVGWSYTAGDAATRAFIATPLINSAPVAVANGPYQVAVGQQITFSSAGSSDPDGDPLSALWSAGGGTVSGDTFTAGQVVGVFDVGLVVNDGKLDSAPAVTTVEVFNPNRAPVAVANGPYRVAVGQQITFNSAGSSDPDGDALTALWTAGGGMVFGNTFTAGQVVGVYDVGLVVNDGQMNSAPVATSVVVFNPNGGFVTGGGWIKPSTGKATFSLSAQYATGASVPTGSVQFAVGNVSFASTNLQWLVVNGARAQFSGEGTLNGVGRYGFTLTVIDGQVAGGGGVDKFRIKIWDIDNGDTVVYDNQPGALDSAAPTTRLGGGNIVIHKAI